jgi:ribonuclease E
MTKRMLIDSTHAEETRVVVLDGTRLEDFDVETSTKKQLKGNIYLAKVVRVEPSLQAAFIEYGGGRHGFLAFSEIHPDYYQIPVADRQRLLELQAAEAREEEEAEEAGAEVPGAAGPERESPPPASHWEAAADRDQPAEAPGGPEPDFAAAAEDLVTREPVFPAEPAAPEGPIAREERDAPEEHGAPEEPAAAASAAPPVLEAAAPRAPLADAEAPAAMAPEAPADPAPESPAEIPPRPAQAAAIERDERFGPIAEAEISDAEFQEVEAAAVHPAEADTLEPEGDPDGPGIDQVPADMPPPETIGGEGDNGDAAEEARARRTARFLRNYRIQEVIRRRQIMLVQVVKEERGTKGAALTTYISLAGRYCVLMPNSPRGGGISRKITSPADRRRLKEITAELDVPNGMGLIVRTAGANRPKAEIKRDCEYLMRLWDDIREHTMRSVAPALIYEEASLIKRAIRDVYSRDIDEVIVDGEEGWRAAHEFMRMLMPSHAKKVQLWRGNGQGPGQPLFAKYQVEAQLDAMLLPTVQLRSGGYLVINQTEALVAIDVNSGRSTRERGIEETALRTNLEAADEVARQLRLRDLAGLIVIDFIDMEAKKHNAAVERRLKEALKIDRARIQVGHISHFGLMEMSRQRLRPSLAETSFILCPHCAGTGHVRSTESSAIHILRAIEDEGAKGRAAVIRLQAAPALVLYLLNHKRERLAEIEARYAMRVFFEPDETLVPPHIRIERVKPQVPEAERTALERLHPAPVAPAAPMPLAAEDEAEAEIDDEEVGEEAEVGGTAAPAGEAAHGTAEEAERRRRRRRRRRGAGRRETGAPEAGAMPAEAGQLEPEPADGIAPVAAAEPAPVDPALAEQPEIEFTDTTEEGAARRRGRRGGRRRRRGEGGVEEATTAVAVPIHTGPTPADPFGGTAYDFYDMLDQEPPLPPAEPPPASTAVAEPPALPDIVPLGDPDAAAEPAPAEPVLPEIIPLAGAEAVEAVATVEAGAAPKGEPEPEPAPAPAIEAAAPAPKPEPEPEPAVKPILVGEDEPAPAERRHGWWRR